MKKLALIGMVVAGILLSSSIALAKPTGMTKAEYQALITRSEAMNLKYGQYEYAHPVVPSQLEPSTPKVTRADVNQKLEEIGAWAVPSKQKVARADVNQKLEEIGAWAVPSKQTTSKPSVSSSGNGFDWSDAGIGAALAFVGLLGIGAVLTVRHNQDTPIPYWPITH
jgi:hypothetical protein